MKKENNSFELSLNELEEIIEKLEKGDLTLDESIEYFQKGIELSKYCSKELDAAQKKISILIEDKEGNLEKKELRQGGESVEE